MKKALDFARRICVGLAVAGLLPLSIQPLLAADAQPQPAQALHALFDRHWEWTARTFPEFASYRGDHR